MSNAEERSKRTSVEAFRSPPSPPAGGRGAGGARGRGRSRRQAPGGAPARPTPPAVPRKAGEAADDRKNPAYGTTQPGQADQPAAPTTKKAPDAQKLNKNGILFLSTCRLGPGPGPAKSHPQPPGAGQGDRGRAAHHQTAAGPGGTPPRRQRRRVGCGIEQNKNFVQFRGAVFTKKGPDEPL